MSPENLANNENIESKKRRYFSAMALRVASAFKLHRNIGQLWERSAERKRDWGNVSEHCLVEVARTEVLAELAGLPSEIKRSLSVAAASHDYGKKQEILAIKEAEKKNESTQEAMRVVNDQSENIVENQFGEEILQLMKAAGGYPNTLIRIKEILDKPDLNRTDIAMLIMHYVDGYTNGSEWVKPFREGLNDIDRKRIRLANEPKYQRTEAEALAYFNLNGPDFFRGKTSAQALSDVCHLIERRLAEIIRSKSSQKVDPLELPEFIDNEIRKRIEAV